MSSVRYELIYFTPSGDMHRVGLNQFGKNRITIGRSEQADVQFADPGISHIHGCFELTMNGVYYEDCGSTNGTVIEEGAEKIELRRSRRKVLLGSNSVLYVRKGTDRFCFFVREEVKGSGWKKIAVSAKALTIGRGEKMIFA